MAVIASAKQARLTWKLDARLALFVAVTVASAVAAEALWITAWRGGQSNEYALMAVMVLIAATASHFPVQLTPKFKTSAEAATYFAMLLLYPAPVAIALVGLSVLLGSSTLALRRNSDGRRRRGLYDTVFNMSQTTLATAAGAWVLYALRPEASAYGVVTADAWALPLSAAAMYLTTTTLVAVAVALYSGRALRDIFSTAHRLDFASQAALYLIGFITALVTTTHPWAPVLMIVPTAVVYLSTARAVALAEQTTAAVEAMADIVDRRDQYTAEHSRRVAANVAVICAAMGLSRDDVAMIELAARVHDLGKVALPDSVLMNQGKLSANEMAAMRRHPWLGYEILAKFPQYRQGREVVLAHHERVDGKGYPRGLRGDQIPLGAQIVAVADALDAMTSDRPYRAALPLHQAMTELRLGRGTQWSAAVVDTIDRLLNVEQRELAFRYPVGAVSAS
jgi:HD-GYP domain-containing protein (c-di-GMP phosphodiesterase class II)